MSTSTPGIAVASEHFPIGYGGTDGLVCRPTCRFEPGLVEKDKEFVAMTVQMTGEPRVDRVGETPRQQFVETGLEAADCDRHTVRRDVSRIPAIAKPEGVSEDLPFRRRP